jgi:hypothetical protein
LPGFADSLAAIVQWALSGSLGSRMTDGRGSWVWEFREWLPGLADSWRSPESLVVACCDSIGGWHCDRGRRDQGWATPVKMTCFTWTTQDELA